jgi:hypothetical protein
MAYLDAAKQAEIVALVGPASLRRQLQNTLLPEIATAIATDAVAGGVGPYLPDVAGTNEASHFVLLDANKAQDELRGASLLIGASGAEVAVTATPAELNVLSGFSGSAADVEAVSGMEAELVLLSGLTASAAELNAISANPGALAQVVVRIESAVEDTETVTIGADVYEVNTKDVYGGANIELDLAAGSTVKAQGTLTLDTQPTAGDTMTVGAVTYTFVPDGTANSDGEINIGSDLADAKVDIQNAIDGSDGYNTIHPTVTMADFVANDAVFTAIAGGTNGNALASTETFTAGTNVFDAATLGTTTAGVDPTAGEASDALVAAINASGTEAATAFDIDDNEVLVLRDVVGVDTEACSETLAGANNSIDAAFRVGGAAAQISMASFARVPTAQEVATGNMHIGLDFVPSSVIIQVRTTATGALVAWDGAATITDGALEYVTIDNSGAVDWSVAETVYVLAFA